MSKYTLWSLNLLVRGVRSTLRLQTMSITVIYASLIHMTTFSLCITFYCSWGREKEEAKEIYLKELHISFSRWFSWQLLMKYFTVLFFLCKIYSQIQSLSSSAFSFILYTWTIIHWHLPGTSPFSLSDQFMMKIKIVEITGMAKMDRWVWIVYPPFHTLFLSSTPPPDSLSIF